MLLRKLFRSHFISFCLMLILGAHLFAADLDGSNKEGNSPPDVIVFTNGDQLTGKLLREVSGTVVFQSDIVGEVNVKWEKIRELRTSGKFVVLRQDVGVHTVRNAAHIPQGPITVADAQIEVQPENTTGPVPLVPVAKAQYIVDQATFNKQLREEPNFFTGWNGNATAGATVVQGTQNQYTFTGAITLARIVPTVLWLNTRNRTTINYSQSYGKITSPAYIASDGSFVPSSYTKSSIYHADAERDQYFSTRFYALVQTAFDHNFSQGLSLQQIYGGGIGLTAIKQSSQALDFKGTLQYEKQEFYAGAAGTNQDLIASTFAGTYMLKLPKSIIFNQQVSYLPAYNYTRAYSATESNSLIFPFYKDLSFSVGTNDSYLNDPPLSEPPTRRNSFQLTTGVTYTIRSRY
jgi:hypothetical protein